MANPTLINGFEDVMTFISQQAERIKRLEEKNNKLQKELEEKKFDCEFLAKQLKAKYKDSRRIQGDKRTVGEVLESEKELKEKYEVAWKQSEKSVAGALEMSAELYELKEENEKLKKKYELSLEQTDKLEEENKNLNKYLAETKIHLCFEEDMKKLQEENEKLKGQVKKAVELYNLVTVRANDDNDDLQKRIDGLTEENEQLKEDIQQYKDTLEEHFVHYDNLKEENKKVQDFAEIIADLATMIENIDQNACDVFNKLTEKYRDEVEELKCN